MSKEFPYSDKNSERRLLFARCVRIKEVLESRISTLSKEVGGFLFRDGQQSIDDIEKGGWREFGSNEYRGYREQYCWFKHTVKLPEKFSGKN